MEDKTEERPNIFEDDLVCLTSNKSKVGEVVRLGWGAKCTEMHENGESCEESSLDDNLVLVGWTNGELTKEDPKNLTVLERYVSLGDVVQKVDSEKEGLLMGNVTNISMYLSVETKKGTLTNVNCENIKHLHQFQRDEFVITKKGNYKWIGRVYNSISDVTILFEDGGACVIPEADSSVLKVVGGDKKDENPHEPSTNFNLGDVVRPTKKVLKEAEWVSGKNNNKRGVATIVDIQPCVIFVDWISNGDWVEKDDFPPGECMPKDLLMIDPFFKFNWGIGDMCQIKKGMDSNKELDQVLKTEFEKSPVASLKNKNNNKGASVKSFISNNTGKVLSLCTFIDVLWQDGTTSEKLPSTSILPVLETSEKDFFPNEFVFSQSNEKEVGVVQKVNVKDRTCSIKWTPESNVNKDRLDQNGIEQDVPIFAIREHPYNELRLASCVIRMPPKGNEQKNNKNWCGFIIKAKDFKVTVNWNSGEVAEEDPVNLMVLPTSDDDDDLSLGDDFEGENEDEEKDEQDVQNQSDFVFNFGESKVLKPTKLESFNKALEENKNLIIVLFGETWNMQCAQMMNTLDSLSSQHTDVTFIYVNVEEYKPTEANDSKTYPSFRVIHQKKVLSTFEGSDENQLKGEIERWNQSITKVGGDSSVSGGSENNNSGAASEGEKQSGASSATNEELNVSKTSNYTELHQVEPFCALPGSPSAHCFLVQQKETVNSKVVLKEIGLLNRSLPKGVFVRLYESRLDILRVLIFPNENSPLCYSPFVFDVQLPSQFPIVPPNLFFNSLVREKVHPNLFVNGKVCSSLIGTFEGDSKSKFWDPKTSSLLDLFVYLQGDFLSDAQPYFAEPDFDELKGTKKGEISSQVFNESSVLLSLRNTILALKDTPFVEFKQIIPLFLKEKRSIILDNIRKYLGEDIKIDQPIFHVPFADTSAGFKKVLKSLYEELQKLFGLL